MKTKSILARREVITAFVCIILLLINLGAIGAGGRQRAKEAVCLANLRQWSFIFAAYIEDNNGNFPSGTTPQGYWWVRQMERELLNWKKNKIWFCPTAPQPLYDEWGNSTQNISIFSAWGIYGAGDSYFGPHGIAGSYGLNGYVLSAKPGTIYEGGRSTDDNWRTPNVQNSDNIPVFIDALRFDLWPIPTDPPFAYEYAIWTPSNHIARCCINRHNGAVGCLFMDWSARKVGLKELWTLKWHRSFNTSGPWTKAGGAQPTDWPMWMRGFKDN